MIHFDNSYARLPDRFRAIVAPQPVSEPRLVKFNTALAEELGLSGLRADPGVFAGNLLPEGSTPIAMAYAAHQFGGFVPQLGDGRAILLGEVIDRNGNRRDIQLKGAGPTPFSRNGDGRAALGPVIREYIVSEAMHALGIPTTRALAIATTGEHVYRETALPGAILTRVAASHIRIGTFQFFAARGDTAGLRILADYVIDRHYPELKHVDQPYLELLRAAAGRQAALIARWMHVGFIHGVMNTDNMTVSGETIDFGPCAFLDEYDSRKVFSSIDRGGRYAYANQPGIGQWNIARLAEALLPLMEADEDRALESAQLVLADFGQQFQTHWLDGMRAKIGLLTDREGDLELVQSLLETMHMGQADFTLTFRALGKLAGGGGRNELLGLFTNPEACEQWLARWRQRLAEEPLSDNERFTAMAGVNPSVIPRNHRIQEAITAAVTEDNFEPFEKLLVVLANPYSDNDAKACYQTPPETHERVTQTFCGT